MQRLAESFAALGKATVRLELLYDRTFQTSNRESTSLRIMFASGTRRGQFCINKLQHTVFRR
jgi:hypothetical protein